MFRASRFITNELLSEQIERHKQFKEGRRFTRLRAKEGHEWLQELSFPIVRGLSA